MSALGIALLSIGLLLAGGGIGFYLARLSQAADNAKLEEVETEFDAYRQQVTDHFSKTADQFHAIGQQYRELYEHLAEGSEALCKLDGTDREPPFPLALKSAAAGAAADAVGSPLVDEAVDEFEATVEEPVDESVEEVAAEVIDDVGLVAAVAEAERTESDADETVEAQAELADEASITDVVDVDVEVEESVEEVVLETEVDEQMAADDAETPDNVVELIPRAEDEETEDGERSIR